MFIYTENYTESHNITQNKINITRNYTKTTKFTFSNFTCFKTPSFSTIRHSTKEKYAELYGTIIICLVITTVLF